MSTQILQFIVVSGINSGTDHEDLVSAHLKAHEYFEAGLISLLTPVGHNFVQSFCVFPTGSGQGREDQQKHAENIPVFCAYLTKLGLDFVACQMSDSRCAKMLHAS